MRNALVGAALLLSGFAAVLLPWEAWVYHETGRIIPVSSGGGASIWDGLTFAAEGEEYQPRAVLPAHLLQFMESLNQSSSTPNFDGSLAQIWGAFSAQARENPGTAAQLIGLKALRAWYGTESGRLETFNIILQIGYLSLAALGASKAWRGRRRAKNLRHFRVRSDAVFLAGRGIRPFHSTLHLTRDGFADYTDPSRSALTI